MNEKVDVVELQLEGVDCVGLGDAAEETKQISPAPYSPDSAFGWGWPTL